MVAYRLKIWKENSQTVKSKPKKNDAISQKENNGSAPVANFRLVHHQLNNYKLNVFLLGPFFDIGTPGLTNDLPQKQTIGYFSSSHSKG